MNQHEAMKRIRLFHVLFAGLLAAAPLMANADVFFNDTFGNGSTVNSTNPAAPTVNSTSYQVVSGKAWNPDPSITNQDLKFGIGATTGGTCEMQALFGTNTITLVQVGDYVQLIVTFTNTSGLLTANGGLSFGLYDSGGVQPVAGGMNGTCRSADTDQATGGVQNWQGYVAQIGYTNAYSSRIMTRAQQTGTDNRNQDLVTSGSGSYSYGNPSATAIGPSSTAPSVALTTNQVYTDVLTVALTNVNALAITNRLYVGTDTNTTPLTQFGGVATGSTYLTSGFDGLAVGWYEKGGQATTIEISSIVVAGQYTKVTAPPDITSQPANVTVPDGGTCAFFVTAQGFNMSYQWHRGGTNLVDGGNISGAQSDTLVISPASAADVASGANGYYVTVYGAGGFSTNSATASLSLGTAKNLTWVGSVNGTWDLNTTANWKDSLNNPSVFNFGDNVTFNGPSANTGITLDGRYLSASSVTVDGGTGYSFSGTGSIAGPGTLNFLGTFLDIANANTYTGGTIISNSSALLYLENYGGLGTGPVTFAQAGAILELPNTGSASSGIPGDIHVDDDGIIAYDATNSSYAVVLFGNLVGNPGKQLSIQRFSSGSDTCRVRVYGNNTMYDGDLNLFDSSTLLATYESSGTQAYNGVISGPGAIMIKGKTTYLNGANTYSGGTYPVTGSLGLGNDSALGTGPLLLTVDSTTSTTSKGEIFASDGAHTIANPIQYPSGSNNLTLVIGGSNDLTLSGSFTLNGADGGKVYTNRIIQVDNTGLTTISGVISDGGAGFGLTKNGDGTLALNNSETYSGATTVGAGTLLVNAQLGSGAVTVQSGGSLGGSGSIGGPVTVESGGALAPGNGTAVATLNINNSLTLNGNLLVDINKSLSPASSNDTMVVSGALNNSGSGSLTVNNLGPELAAGDKFQIFNKALAGNTMTVTGAGAVWNNNLAVDGSISVASVTIPQPVINSTTFLSGNGGVVMSGTNGFAGNPFYVLSSTNLATPLTNWTRVSTNYFVTGGAFSVTNAVSAGVPQTFYILQVP